MEQPLKDAVNEFIKTSEDGVTEDMLMAKFPETKKNEMACILNTLLQTNSVEVTKKNNILLYRGIHNRNTSYEALIVGLVAQSGSSGLWLKDIKSKTNIPHNLLLKILKTLEDTRKIKSVRSVKNNRKTYVLFDTKPDEEISGGVWFSNNDVDSVFVQKLMDLIVQFVRKEEGPFTINRIEDLVKFKTIKDIISKSGVCQVEMSAEDVNTLVDCLIYDGRLEKIETDEGILLRVLKDEYMKL